MDSNLLDSPIIRMPHFGKGDWINTAAPIDSRQLRGKIVIVDFWDFSCVNCVRTLPYLREWYRRYKRHGLEIIGVHAPEFGFGKDPQQVRAAINAHELPYPILLDNQYETWEHFTTRAWPTKFLIDPAGYIRLKKQGEGEYGRFEQGIQQLIHAQDPTLRLPSIMSPVRDEDIDGAVCYPTTPELYAGYQTAGFFHTPGLSNPPDFISDNPLIFEKPEIATPDRFSIAGIWRLHPEAVSFAGQEMGELELSYRGLGANAVLSWTPDPVALRLDLRDETPAIVEISQDGLPLSAVNAGADVQWTDEGQSFIIVDRPRLYQLTKNPTFGQYLLQLTFKKIGVTLYTFTFTSCITGDSL